MAVIQFISHLADGVQRARLALFLRLAPKNSRPLLINKKDRCQPSQ